MLDGLRRLRITRPVLVLNPRMDRQFVAAADGIVDDGVVAAGELQARLRLRWPDAVVRPRGLSGEQPTMWYVYRDGRWTPDAWVRKRLEGLRRGS
jgi:DNA-binding transcriptional LysR family regulator